MRRTLLDPPPDDFDLSLAELRHRSGMSCKTPAAYTYDASGHQRWCIDCKTELPERSWHEDGDDVSPRLIGLVCAALAVTALVVVALMALLSQGANGSAPGAPTHTPTVLPSPMPHPDANWRGVQPRSLPRRTPSPTPVVP